MLRCAGFCPPALNRPLETDAGRFFLLHRLWAAALTIKKY